MESWQQTDIPATAPVTGPIAPSGVVSEPMPPGRVVQVSTTAQAQAAFAAARRGDTIQFAPGTYTPPAVWPKTWPLFTLGMSEVFIRGLPGVVIDGQNRVDTLLEVDGATKVEIWQLKLTRAARSGLVLHNVTKSRVWECVAVDCTLSKNIIMGGFRVSGGASDQITFEACWASGNVIGYEIREEPTLTAPKASAPPIAGNIGYPASLPESAWSSWFGWDQGPREIYFIDCVAVNNSLNTQHSDGFSARYARGATFTGCVGLWNADDGFDGIANADLSLDLCFAGWNGLRFADNVPTGGNGNGIKCGVRGGLRASVDASMCVGNSSAGVTYADCEQGVASNLTVLGNPKSVTTEATRSASKVALTITASSLSSPPAAANGAKIAPGGVTIFVPSPQSLTTLRDNVHALCMVTPQPGGVTAWMANFKTQVAAWTSAAGWPVP